jgi:hypothetical protein
MAPRERVRKQYENQMTKKSYLGLAALFVFSWAPTK